MNKKNIVLSLAAALCLSPLAVSVVQAQAATGTSTSQTTKAQSDYSSTFLSKLAAALGITQGKLDSSLQSAQSATVDQMLKDGVITQAQATQMKADTQSGRFGLFGRGPGMGRGGPGMDRGMDGPGMGGRGMNGRGPGVGQALEAGLLDAAAKALKLSSAALESQLQSGQTLAQIAATQKVDLQTVKDATLSALKTQLRAEVSSSRLTQAQADAILSRAQQDPNFGLHGGVRGGRGPGSGGRGQGDPVDSANQG